jgi:hypothetical protein
MLIEQVDSSKRSKLMLELEKMLRAIQKRGVTSFVNAHTGEVANITIIVTGRKGTIQKSIVVVYNKIEKEWQLFSDGAVFTLNSFSEINTLVRSTVQRLSTLLSRI